MSIAAEVVERLASRGLTLATAEASIGGLVGHLLTDVPGASRVYLGGGATYANRAKHDLLGVPESLLVEHGAVSEPVVIAMARGAREVMRSDLALAESGVAGPGGTPERPTGTYVLVLAGDGTERVLHRQFAGDRAAVKQQAAEAMLQLVLDYLDETG
ncbi:MAG: CinA family protein [Dehalococcoidia bacterium]